MLQNIRNIYQSTTLDSVELEKVGNFEVQKDFSLSATGLKARKSAMVSASVDEPVTPPAPCARLRFTDEPFQQTVGAYFLSFIHIAFALPSPSLLLPPHKQPCAISFPRKDVAPYRVWRRICSPRAIRRQHLPALACSLRLRLSQPEPHTETSCDASPASITLILRNADQV